MEDSKFWNQLNTTQQQLIKKYLDHRISGLPIVVDGSVKASQTIIERRRRLILNELSQMLRQVICGRQDKDYRKATDVSSDAFDILDFIPSDIYLIQKWHSKYAFYLKCCMLKPFLYFVLMLEEQETLNDPSLDAEFNQIRKRINATVAMMPAKAPPPSKRKKVGKKVFLKRQQVISVYQELLQAREYESYRAKLQTIVAFMMFMFAGTRSFELSWLRVENFQLDGDDHIKTDENGFGILRITVNKGEYSPSHKYGTLLVPNLVLLINRYLDYLYEMNPDSRGKGYLFPSRSSKYDPESRVVRETLWTWLKSRRNELESLPEDIRPYLSTHDGRHTMNQLIKKAYVPRRFMDDRERAAEIQMRHNINLTEGTVSDTNYTEEIPFESYYEIINCALNFPWNLEELHLWEQQMGYVDPPKDTKGHSQVEVLPIEEIEQEVQPVQPTLKVKEIEAELKKLVRGCPSGMKVREWTNRINELKAAIATAKEVS